MIKKFGGKLLETYFGNFSSFAYLPHFNKLNGIIIGLSGSLFSKHHTTLIKNFENIQDGSGGNQKFLEWNRTGNFKTETLCEMYVLIRRLVSEI